MKTKSLLSRILTIFSLILGLAYCGGGDGDTPNNNNNNNNNGKPTIAEILPKAEIGTYLGKASGVYEVSAPKGEDAKIRFKVTLGKEVKVCHYNVLLGDETAADGTAKFSGDKKSFFTGFITLAKQKDSYEFTIEVRGQKKDKEPSSTKKFKVKVKELKPEETETLAYKATQATNKLDDLLQSTNKEEIQKAIDNAKVIKEDTSYKNDVPEEKRTALESKLTQLEQRLETQQTQEQKKIEANNKRTEWKSTIENLENKTFTSLEEVNKAKAELTTLKNEYNSESNKLAKEMDTTVENDQDSIILRLTTLESKFETEAKKYTQNLSKEAVLKKVIEFKTKVNNCKTMAELKLLEAEVTQLKNDADIYKSNNEVQVAVDNFVNTELTNKKKDLGKQEVTKLTDEYKNFLKNKDLTKLKQNELEKLQKNILAVKVKYADVKAYDEATDKLDATIDTKNNEIIKELKKFTTPPPPPPTSTLKTPEDLKNLWKDLKPKTTKEKFEEIKDYKKFIDPKGDFQKTKLAKANIKLLDKDKKTQSTIDNELDTAIKEGETVALKLVIAKRTALDNARKKTAPKKPTEVELNDLKKEANECIALIKTFKIDHKTPLANLNQLIKDIDKDLEDLKPAVNKGKYRTELAKLINNVIDELQNTEKPVHAKVTALKSKKIKILKDKAPGSRNIVNTLLAITAVTKKGKELDGKLKKEDKAHKALKALADHLAIKSKKDNPYSSKGNGFTIKNPAYTYAAKDWDFTKLFPVGKLVKAFTKLLVAYNTNLPRLGVKKLDAKYKKEKDCKALLLNAKTLKQYFFKGITFVLPKDAEVKTAKENLQKAIVEFKKAWMTPAGTKDTNEFGVNFKTNKEVITVLDDASKNEDTESKLVHMVQLKFDVTEKPFAIKLGKTNPFSKKASMTPAINALCSKIIIHIPVTLQAFLKHPKQNTLKHNMKVELQAPLGAKSIFTQNIAKVKLWIVNTKLKKAAYAPKMLKNGKTLGGKSIDLTSIKNKNAKGIISKTLPIKVADIKAKNCYKFILEFANSTSKERVVLHLDKFYSRSTFVDKL